MKNATASFKTSIKYFLFIIIAIICIGLGAAKNAPAQHRGPCAEDVAKFCKDEKPGGGAIAKCLEEHENDLSPVCKEHVAKMEQKVEDFKDACQGDLVKFCKDVKPGGGAIAKCLKAHENDLSPTCKERVSQTKQKVQDFKEACQGDVTKFCNDVPPGGGRILQCLKGHEVELSPACKAKMTK